VRAKNDWTQAEMARGESKSGLKRPRKIIPRPRKNQTKAEQGPQNQSEVREGSHQAEEKLDVAEVHYMCSGEFFPL
jgi:hypothetical protein